MTNKAPYQSCQHCVKPMGDKSIQGLCPACLMKAGWPTSEEATPGGFEPPAIEDVARLFPQLEILELIGRGGMGAVYKARQPDLDRLVALKILARKSDSDPGFTERFTREARALAKLSHPNIVGVHDFGHRSFCGKPTVGQSPSENSGGAAGETGDVERIVDGAQQSQMNLQPGDAREVSHTSSDLSWKQYTKLI